MLETASPRTHKPKIVNESLLISCNLEKYHVSVLKMTFGDASCSHRLLHDKVGYSTVLMLCMLKCLN